MPWAALALAAAVDLALSLARRPAARLDLPAELFIGQQGALTIALEPPRPGARAAADWPAGLAGPAVAPLSAAETVTALPIRAVRRGRWTLSRVWLSWPSRLGLFEIVPLLAPDLSTGVAPDIRPARSGEIATRVRSDLFGIKQNTRVGEGAEFHQLREFTAGMDIRTIDWKQSARHRALLAKEMHAERNHNVLIGIDCGRLMGVPAEGLPKLDHAINAGLALGWAAAVAGDRIGLFTYDARLRAFLPPQGGRTAFARLRARTAEADYAAVESNHTLALSEVGARSPRRSLIVVFSDFVDATTAELLVETLGLLARRHLVMFVSVADAALARHTAAAPRALADVAMTVAAGRALAERRRVLGTLTQLGITVIDAPGGAVTPQLVSAYIEAKLKDRI
ncbi:MAG TPA: DUF58 domain-containing protein [Rhodobacteraceae bacterium]|mgnify:CR=1 FL=1|nr:DUF58 domain-containing protein [Paracoccaceae bacterium]HBG97219.1 DUF58 domain-containing protein [Paracoccaceae bacterium]